MANNHYQKQPSLGLPPGLPPGLPFPFPPPSFQQGPHHPQTAQPSQHAPPLPPPGTWSLPGLHQNLPQPPPFAPQVAAAHSQNAQPPYPPPASWSHAPMHDWMHLMQSGALPPFPPGLPPPPFPPNPNASTTPGPAAPAAPQPPTAPVPHHPALHAVASDKEDGEVSDVSDGDMAPRSQKTQPAPPRSAPQPARPVSRFQDTYDPDRPSAGHAATKEPVRKPLQPSTATQKEPADMQQRRDEAKQFVRLLNSNQIGYRALAGENLDKVLLRELYSSLNLPSEPEPIPPLGPSSSAAPSAKPTSEPVSKTHPLPAKSVPSISTKVATPAAASAPSPVDRKDYIARLQAARLAAKQPSTAKSSPQPTPPDTIAASPVAVKTPQETMTPTKKSSVTEEQKARNTEVIRQRLEQLRAKNKQSLPSRPNMSGTNTSASQSQASSFGGIPGLFMNAPSNSSNGIAAPKSMPPSSHKASDTETSTPRGSVTPYTRPLGQSPYSYQEESMIIQVSDDESNGSDMDIDDDQAPSNPPVIRQGPGNIPGLPRRPAQAETASSIMITSGPQTPSSSARTGEMSSKEKELAAMKLTLKKKLAEQKRIREAAAAAATPKSLPPKPPSQSFTTENTPRPQIAASPSLKRNQATSSENNNNPADRKRRRRTEIQEQLPSLDDEIANNEAEMARIAKDLERLKANNERILQDKNRLTKELEELGIDTEGMSHAELRATKQDIERAMSPDPEDAPQVAATTAQTLTNGKRPSASDVIERMTSIEDQSKTEASLPHRQTGQYGLLPGIGQAFQAPKTTIQSHAPTSTAVVPPEPELKARNDYTATPTAVETRGSATPMDDDEDFYSPPPESFVDGQNETTSALAPHVQVETSGEAFASMSEEGEVDMSESSEDEDEYEPEEPEQMQGLRDSQELHVAKEPQVPAPDTANESTDDEGVYEPPDVDEQTAYSQVDGTAGESPAQGEVEDDAMDIASSSDEDSDESDSDSEQESSPEPEVEQAHTTDRVQQSTNTGDGLAPELQSKPAFELAPVEPTAEATPVLEAAEEPARFVPYESPLRMFKSYRYHQQYSQDVADGFLSLTFSHQIDPEQPLCPYESAGGSCNDPKCLNQHFRNMGITGEKLLVQLGTANPGKTADEKQQWNDGLRSVLKELRQKNIKDPNGIAQEIARYRRQFLNDDTRVVNL